MTGLRSQSYAAGKGPKKFDGYKAIARGNKVTLIANGKTVLIQTCRDHEAAKAKARKWCEV